MILCFSRICLNIFFFSINDCPQILQFILLNSHIIYLSAAFHLHLISPLIFIPIVVFENYAVVVIIFWILIGCFTAPASYLLFGVNTPYVIPDMSTFSEMKNSVMHYWMGTNQHISTFSLGILIGYLIKNKPNMNLGKIWQYILWVVTPICSVIGIVWIEQFNYYEIKTTHLQNFSQKIGRAHV